MQGAIRPRDERTLAGLVALALAVLVAGWFVPHAAGRRVVVLDRAPARSIRFQVDLNRAQAPELMLLPGIGETLAGRIVDFREQHGPFRCPTQLAEVHGIGPATLARLREHVVQPAP